MVRILVVDDQKAQRKNLAFYLKSQGYDVDTSDTGEGALEKIDTVSFDLIICDYKLGVMNGRELMNRARNTCPSLDFIIMTAFGSIPLAVDLIKDGAADFISKPFEYAQLHEAIKKTLKKRQATPYSENGIENSIVAESQKMKDILELAAKGAASDVSILIEGEAGTGKEILAEYIHKHSQRYRAHFAIVDCCGYGDAALDSQIFGVDEKGCIMRADGGTVFIRNVDQLSVRLQAKLLRFLRDGVFAPAESSVIKKADVRIIAGTTRDIKLLMQNGSFRDDLYYLLSVMPFYIPPLRSRQDDIIPLVRHFLNRYRSKSRKNINDIAPEVISWMTSYEWPGNVQELENVISRACALASNETLDESLIFTLPQDRPQKEEDHGYLNITLKDNQRTLILKALKQNNGNFSRTASQLGISRTTLWRRLKKFKIEGLAVEQD